MISRADHYIAISRAYLQRAYVYLANDDLLQASEKGWGAAAVMVKAVAEARGWRHDSHRDLWNVVRGVAHDEADLALIGIFREAGSLHGNFYEGWLSPEAVAEGLGQVGALIRILESLPDAAEPS